MIIRKPNVALLFSILCLVFLAMAPQAAAEGELTIIVFPDTQNAATSYPAVFNSMAQYIASNKTLLNVAFVTSVGDLVNTANSTTEWVRADAAFDILDAAGVPYSVGPGNHDLPLYVATSYYNDYFGISRFTGKSWYGGHYGSDNYNNYSLFSAAGMDFIIINLQYTNDITNTAYIDWADALLKANPTRRGIVVKHDILRVNDTYDTNYNGYNNANFYTALKDNPNLFLMLCGHMHGISDGAAYRAELGDDGHTIHIMLADYQDYPNGGNGYLRILRFSPSEDKIYATTYSPYIPASITTYPDQMEMVYDMSVFLYGDFGTSDCDVDGSDLAVLIANSSIYDVSKFAGNFGKSVCQ